MHFDYIRLRARIREKLGSDVVFAARLGISKTSLSLRLNNQLHFSQRDIYNSMRILQIRPDEVGAYFFERPRCEEFYFDGKEGLWMQVRGWRLLNGLRSGLWRTGR